LTTRATALITRLVRGPSEIVFAAGGRINSVVMVNLLGGRTARPRLPIKDEPVAGNVTRPRIRASSGGKLRR